jgi:hypothetical protein
MGAAFLCHRQMLRGTCGDNDSKILLLCVFENFHGNRDLFGDFFYGKFAELFWSPSMNDVKL